MRWSSRNGPAMYNQYDNRHIFIESLGHELSFPGRKSGLGRWPIVLTVAVGIPAGVLRATLRFNGLRMMYRFGVATKAGVLRTKLHSSVEHNTRRANESPSRTWLPHPSGVRCLYKWLTQVRRDSTSGGCFSGRCVRREEEGAGSLVCPL
jgi:hypothetical protein